MNTEKIGTREVFCRYIRKNGKIVYPRTARYFHFFIEEKAENEKRDESQK